MIPMIQEAPEILDREFLPLRAKLLEVAAAMDRIRRGEGSAADDPRMRQIREALQLLATADGDFAERFQMVFSIPYSENWRDELRIGD